MKEPKQVIVIRTDLGMSLGKMVAQGAHAAVLTLTNSFEDDLVNKQYTLAMTPNLHIWLDQSHVKIILAAPDENTLMNIYSEAQNLGLRRSMVKDEARTELTKPEYTAVAIGPGDPDVIDTITGHLYLL